jgi:hypothetical protein
MEDVNTLNRVSSRDAKNNFGQIAGEVGFAKHRIIITRNRRDFMALIPIDDLKLLQTLEDYFEAQLVERVREDIRSHGTVSHEEIAEEFGLKDEISD